MIFYFKKDIQPKYTFRQVGKVPIAVQFLNDVFSNINNSIFIWAKHIVQIIFS